MISSNTVRPAAAATASGPREIELAGGSISPRDRRTKAGNQAVIAISVVDKSTMRRSASPSHRGAGAMSISSSCARQRRRSQASTCRRQTTSPSTSRNSQS